MSNILNLPQVPAIAIILSQDGDWLDSIFFPADTNIPPDPLDLSGIRFVANFRRLNDAQIILPMDTLLGSIINSGPLGFINFSSLAQQRTTILPAAACSADLFAIADGYQRNLSEAFGPMTLTIRADTL